MTSALVIGSNSDIGLAICKKFRRAGIQVIGVGSATSASEVEWVDDYYSCDLTSDDECKNLIKSMQNDGINVDKFIYCAGHYVAKPLKSTTYADYLNSFILNTAAPAFISSRITKLRSNAQEQQAIVVVGSVSGVLTEPGLGAYSASKAALEHITRILARELAGKGVRVNCVHPGWVESKRSKSVSSRMTNQQLQSVAAQYPLGFGSVEDIAHTVDFLCSTSAKWITGQVIAVDGGRCVVN